MKMNRLLTAAALLLPAGCLADPEPTPQDGCGAAELAYLVGQPGSVLQTMTFSEPVRIIDFGQPITMDMNPERLNIRKDPAGVIDRIWCG